MFNYFLPGLTKEKVAPGDQLDRTLLASLGLADVLADVRAVPGDAAVTNISGSFPGIGSGSGTVIVPVRKYSGVPHVTCDPIQTWRPGPGGKFWLGYVTKERPSSRELERKELVAGEDITDEAGNVWIVPIARAPHCGAPYGTLPQAYTFDDAGEVVSQLDAKYRWLWDLAGEVREWYLGGPTENGPESDPSGQEPIATPKPKPPFSLLVKYAARLLGVNYRVGLPELTALHAAGCGVLTQKTVHAICRAAYGWEVLVEAKKNETDGGNQPAASSSTSSTGDEIPRESPGTVPAAEPSMRL